MREDAESRYTQMRAAMDEQVCLTHRTAFAERGVGGRRGGGGGVKEMASAFVLFVLFCFLLSTSPYCLFCELLLSLYLERRFSGVDSFLGCSLKVEAFRRHVES